MGEVQGKSVNGIVSIERSGQDTITLDQEGRILYFSAGNDTWKRSLDGRYTRIGWDGDRRIIETLDADECVRVSERAMVFLREISAHIEDAALRESVEGILQKSPDWLAEDASRFTSLYNGQFPIIPQDQRFSIYFQLTSGQNWNYSTFSAPGREIPQKTEPEFADHVRKVIDVFGKGMELRRGAFIGDAAALSSEQKPLLAAMDSIRREIGLPIYTFVEAFSVPRKKNMIHYGDLKRHGLSRVYVGIQSGSVSLLRKFEKLKNVSEILNLVNNLKNSGISVGLILLTGYGGNLNSDDHVNETASIISQMDLDEGDIIYISPMDENDDPRYADLVSNGTFDVMDYEAKKAQADLLEKRIREEFLGSNRTELRTQISRYDIREGIY